MPASNFAGAIESGLRFKDQQEKNKLARQQQFLQLDDQRKGALFQDARTVNSFLKSGQTGQALNVLSNRANILEQIGGDTSDTREIADFIARDDIKGAISLLDSVEEAGMKTPNQSTGRAFLDDPRLIEAELARASGVTAETRAFDKLTEGLTSEQRKEATLIKLGLSPRAVGSAIQTISDKGIEEQIGKSKATIRQREKFGELTATRRSKVIDNGFSKIEKITAAVNNIDRAIGVLNSGAGVGAIQKFLPSFKAASVELDNIQKSMALDVIGSVTFGALSQGELDLAKEVALPTGLDTPQLIEHLNKRKNAQNKLRDYYGEQIQFLDQGGTVAGFLRSKDREIESQIGSNEFPGFKVVR